MSTHGRRPTWSVETVSVFVGGATWVEIYRCRTKVQARKDAKEWEARTRQYTRVLRVDQVLRDGRFVEVRSGMEF